MYQNPSDSSNRPPNTDPYRGGHPGTPPGQYPTPQPPYTPHGGPIPGPQGYQGGPGHPGAPGLQPPAKKKGKRGRVILGIVALLLVVVCVGGGYLASRDDAVRAEVGDCVSQTGEDSLEIVECTSADAAYKVVGRVEDKTQTQATLSACADYVSAGATASYWEGHEGEPGTVLCLASVA